MTITQNNLLVPANEAELVGPQSESAWRQIAIALGWTVLALACSFAIGVVLGIVKAAFRLPNTPQFQLILLGSAACGFGLVLLFAAVNRGRIAGRGDVWLGLGAARIANLPVIIALAITIVAYAALRDYAVYKIRPDLFYQFSSVGIWFILFDVLVGVVVAPLAEELFFRGWLWTGLTPHWGALSTALFTSAFWLALHLDRGVALTVALLPIALVLCLARQLGKSVRATIPLHAIYNLTVNFPLILMVLAAFQHNKPTLQPTVAPVSTTVVPSTIFPTFPKMVPVSPTAVPLLPQFPLPPQSFLARQRPMVLHPLS